MNKEQTIGLLSKTAKYNTDLQHRFSVLQAKIKCFDIDQDLVQADGDLL